MGDGYWQDRWIRKIADPKEAIGDGGGWRGFFTNARTRLVKVLGKEAEKDIKALTVKQRCELCVQLSDAMSGSPLAVGILEEYAKAEADTPIKRMAILILAKLDVSVVAGQTVGKSAVSRLNYLAELGNKTAFVESAKQSMRSGDTRMMAQLRAMVLADGPMRGAAENVVIDLLKENNPLGVRLVEQLLSYEGQGTLRSEFTDQLYALREDKYPGLAFLLRSVVLQGREGSFTRALHCANTGMPDMAKFVFQLRKSYPDYPHLNQLQNYLSMGAAFKGLANALTVLDRQQFNDRAALGSEEEIARCLAIHDALASGGRERLLEKVRSGNELAGQTLMELHRRGVGWATDDLVAQARNKEPFCSQLAARLVREDGDDNLQRLVMAPPEEQTGIPRT